MNFKVLPYDEAIHGHLSQEVKDLFAVGEVWHSEDYIVVRRLKPHHKWDQLWHLSIKRKDNGKIGWAEKQEIKNSFFGENYEGFEVYPIEGNKIDTSNQYHLWVFTMPYMSLEVPLYQHNNLVPQP